MSANTGLVLFSAVLAAVLVGGARRQAGPGPSVGIDFPQWDFSQSWASNLTVLGAILGTVLSAKILPASTVVVSPDGYTALSLLFGILVVVAPFLYTALRKGKAGPDGPTFTGRNWAFLVASAVTIWAVNGEIGTIGLVLYEAQHGHVLAQGAVIPMLGALGIVLVLTWVYAVQTIALVLRSETAKDAGAREGETGAEGMAALVQPAATVGPVHWTLL